jgi:capsular exopolysaccharide synthesis family protein
MLTDPEEDFGPRPRPIRPARLPARATAQLLEGVISIDEPLDDAGRPQLDLTEYWRLLVKHRWLIVSSIIACLAIGAAVTLLTRPTYTARSTLQIDREAAKVLNVEEVAPRDNLATSEEFFQTQYGLLRAESLAQRVAQNLGLARNDDFLKAMGEKVDDTPRTAADRMDKVVKTLSQHLGVVPTRASRLVSITFTSPDPQLSAKVANAFAENFIGSNLDRRFESSSYARDFLEKRLAQTKAKLEQQERQLVAYAAQEKIINLKEPATGPGPQAEQSLAAANLQALNEALATARAERIRAQQRWVEAAGKGGADTVDVLTNATIQELTQTRAKKVAEYQDKLSVYKPDFPDMKQLKAQIDELDRQIARATNSIRSSVRAQYEVAANSERSLAAQVETLKSDVLDLRNRSIQYNILQREVDTSRTLYDGLLQRYKEVGVAGGIASNNISIVDRAKPPHVPSSPRPVRNMALALVAGAILGLAMAFLREALDQAVRVPADVENKLRLPVLGSIPVLAKGQLPREALADNRSAMSEAYFSLRSALQFSTKDGFPKTMVVTSTRPGEGKSTTAYALAQSMARLGFRTLLVDGDLRNPSLHKTIGADNRAGLSNVLTGAAGAKEVVQAASSPNLFVITSGPLPPNPAELLAGVRLSAFVNAASQDFDMVIIDGPPVMGLADAPLIASVVEGVVLLIEAGKTGRTQARAAVRRLQMANAHILGVVLTKFNAKSASYGYGYAYEYEYAYGKKPEVASAGDGFRRLGNQARKLMGGR